MFRIPNLALLTLVWGFIAAAAEAAVPQAFYTVTGEIALNRREPRVAALQYAAAAEADPALLPRAVEVADLTLQPTIGLRLAERWVRHEPQSAPARRAAAAAALALHFVARAAGHYRAWILKDPEGIEAAMGSVDGLLREADNVYGARQVAELLVRDFPDSANARVALGMAALRADDAAGAVRALRAAQELNHTLRDDPALVQALRRARVISGDVEPVLAEARADLARETSPQRQLDYALLLVAAKRDSEAHAALTQLSLQAEGAPVALLLLGRLEYRLGHDAAAEGYFAALAASGNDVEEAFFYAGMIAERRADPERALTAYARVQSGEFALAAVLRAAAILRTHGEPVAAAQLFDQALDEQPRQAPQIISARAEIERRAADPAGAAATLTAALARYPDSTELVYAQATDLEERGALPASLQELAGLVRRRPLDPAAANALGYTLADHGRELSRARTLIQQAYGLAPDSAAIRDSLGWVLYRQGRGNEAQPILAGAFADDPGAEIGAHLGEVLWKLGRTDEAERIWSQAAAIEPDNRLLRLTRQRLRAGP